MATIAAHYPVEFDAEIAHGESVHESNPTTFLQYKLMRMGHFTRLFWLTRNNRIHDVSSVFAYFLNRFRAAM